MGDVGDFFTDVAYGIGNTIPSIAVSLANPWAGAAVAFTSQYGQSYNQAIGDGKSEDEAMTYAFLNGAISAVLEKALGVVGGSKLAQSVAGKLVKDEAVKSALGKFILRTGASAAGEFTEETLESLLQPIIYNISTSGEDQKLDGDYVLNAFRDGLIGGFTGGAIEAAGTSAKIRQGENTAVNMPNEFNAQNVNTQSGSVQPNVNAQSDITQNDAQSETNRYVQEALMDEMGKLNSAADTKAQNKLTHDDMNKLSDDEMYSLDDEMTKKYGEYLKAQGFSENGIANLLEQSAKNRTSKQSAIDHIMQIQADMGDVGVDVNTDQKSAINNGEAVNQLIEPKISFTDTEIGKLISENAVFTDEQLNNMDNSQLYHVLRTLSFDNEGKIPDLYDKVLALKDAENIDGMKSLVKELQGDRGNNMMLQNGIDDDRINLLDDKMKELNNGPVEITPPPGATLEQIEQVKAYIDGANKALKDGALSSTGRVSTKGKLRRQASRLAQIEGQRASNLGKPYKGHVGHVPDTTWTGNPEPYSWLDLDSSVNMSIGGQANKYPIGYKPTKFIFKEKLK